MVWSELIALIVPPACVACRAPLARASLRLCGLGTKFKDLLRITGLLNVFNVSSNEAEAIQSFAQ